MTTLLTCDFELFLGWVGGAWCLSAKRPDVAVVSKVLGAQATPPRPPLCRPRGDRWPSPPPFPRLHPSVHSAARGCDDEDLKPGGPLQSSCPVRATGGPDGGSGPVQRPDPRAARCQGPPDTSLYCGKAHNIKFTPLPIVQHTAQWRFVHSCCCATSTSVLFQNFFITPRKRHTHEP